jgi:hypothetical protein
MNKDAKLTIFCIGTGKFPCENTQIGEDYIGVSKTFPAAAQLFFETFGDGETFVYFCTLKIHDGQRR